MRVTIFFLLSVLIINGCRKKDVPPHPPKSSAKAILTFTFLKANNPSLSQDYPALITHDTILITISAAINLTILLASVSYSGASISPQTLVPQNFTNSILYTVTAEDGSTSTYKTIFHILSDSSSITSFVFKKTNNPALTADLAGVITGNSISVSTPRGTDVSSLKPTIVYTGVSISPGNEEAEDFSHRVAYAVNAEDGTSRNYDVDVDSHYDVFIHSDDGYLYDINASNGSVKWKYYIGGTGVPTYDDGVVFVAGYNNNNTVVYAINADDGSVKWSSISLQGNYSLSTPAVKYGKVYFGGSGILNYPNTIYGYYAGFVYAINEQTGVQEWLSTYITNNTSISVSNTNVTVQDNLCGIYDGLYGFHAFNASDGTTLWAGFGELGKANPAIANNSVVSGIEGGIAESDENGNPLWNIHDNGNYSSPTINNGIIYTTAAYNNGPVIYAIDQNGSIKWQISPFYSSLVTFYSPFFSSDNLYITNSNGELNSYRASDGSLNWTRSSFGAYPVVVNNDLFISDGSGKFNCLDASSGNVKWTCPAGGVFSGPPCVVDTKDVAYHYADSGEQN